MDLVRDGYPIKSASVLSEVYEERRNQDAKWGEQNHPDGTGGVVNECLAISYRAECDRRASNGSIRWTDILKEEVHEALAETDPVKLRTELVQVAAVAVNWIEAIDRRAAALPAPVAGDQVTTERANTLPVGSIILVDESTLSPDAVSVSGFDFTFPLTKTADVEDGWRNGLLDSTSEIAPGLTFTVIRVGSK